MLETSADLALLLAIVSSYRDRQLPRDMVIFGEVGLSGEIRPVPSGQERLSEAAKHGFKRAIVPKGNAPKGKIDGMQVVGTKSLFSLLEHLLVQLNALDTRAQPDHCRRMIELRHQQFRMIWAKFSFL